MKKKILSLLLIISMFSATFSTMAFAVDSTEDNVIIGDVDGDGYIKANDAMLVLQYVESLSDVDSTLTDDQLYLADVQADGVVDSEDAKLILQDVAGLYDIEANYEEYVEEDSSEVTRVLYETLSDEDKELYNTILEGMMNQEEKIVTEEKTTNEKLTSDEYQDFSTKISSVVGMISYDYPELFWYDTSMGYTSGYSEIFDSVTYTYTFYVQPTYIGTSEEVNLKKLEVNAATLEAVASITEAVASITEAAGNNPTDYDILKAVYDYVVLNVDYNLTSEFNQTVYSSLVNKSSVCAGYAKEVQYLLNEFGISACYVTGVATNSSGSEDHAWNYVLLDDGYYFVDATWGDAYRAQYPTSVYYYYLCGEISQYTSHEEDSDISWPTNFGETYLHGEKLLVIYNEDGTINQEIRVN